MLLQIRRAALLQHHNLVTNKKLVDLLLAAVVGMANRIVILKGNEGRLAYINEFIEHAKASGLVQKAIDRAGPRGLTVAPPGDSK